MLRVIACRALVPALARGTARHLGIAALALLATRARAVVHAAPRRGLRTASAAAAAATAAATAANAFPLTRAATAAVASATPNARRRRTPPRARPPFLSSATGVGALVAAAGAGAATASTATSSSSSSPLSSPLDSAASGSSIHTTAAAYRAPVRRIPLTRTVDRLMADPAVKEQASNFLQSVVSDRQLQKSSGDALWEAIKIAVTPSLFAGKPKPAPGTAAATPAAPTAAAAAAATHATHIPAAAASPAPLVSTTLTAPAAAERERDFETTVTEDAWVDSISDDELQALERLVPDAADIIAASSPRAAAAPPSAAPPAWNGASGDAKALKA